jgi:hypothetical protein
LHDRRRLARGRPATNRLWRVQFGLLKSSRRYGQDWIDAIGDGYIALDVNLDVTLNATFNATFNGRRRSRSSIRRFARPGRRLASLDRGRSRSWRGAPFDLIFDRGYAVIHETSVGKASLSGGASGASMRRLGTHSHLDDHFITRDNELCKNTVVRRCQSFGGGTSTDDTSERSRVGSQLRLLLIDKSRAEAAHRNGAHHRNHH